MQRKTVLFFKLSDSTFSRNDENAIAQVYEVKTCNQKGVSGIKQLFFHIKQFLFLIRNILNSDLIFIWFADYHAFLPLLFAKIFNKKSLLVIGGFDAEKNLSLNYGAHVQPFRSKIVKYCCLWASKLLPVSEYTKNRLFENIEKDLSFKSSVLSNAADTSLFTLPKENKDRKLITTICGGRTERRLLVKGVDFFLELAQAMPDSTFRIVGVEGEALNYIQNKYPLSNLELYPPCKPEEIRNHLQASKIICQLSRYESFGLAVVEGMFCGCIPVVMNVGGLPELTRADIGYIIKNRNTKEGVEILRQALDIEPKQAEVISKFSKKTYSFEVRKSKLLNCIFNHLSQ